MPLKKITHAITIAALFLLPIFPLIVANSFFFPFITGKAFLFRILIEIAFAGWVILTFVDAKYRPKLTPLSIGVTVFTLVTLVADLLGVNPLRSFWSNFERMEGWIMIAHLFALFIVITNVFGSNEEGRKMWYRWFTANLGVATVVGIYGLLQIAGVVAIHQGSSRVDASLGNSAYMAVYMLFSIGIAVFLFLSSKNKWSFKISAKDMTIYWGFIVLSLITLLSLFSSQETSDFFKALSGFISSNPWSFIIGLLVSGISIAYPYRVLPLLFTVMVFETQTRGTILGLLGGIMLALFIYAILGGKDKVGKKEKDDSKKFRYISAGILLVIILGGVIFWMNRTNPIIQKSAIFGRLASISWSEAQGQARNYIWPMAVRGALERPLFGWGQENFNYIFNANYNPKMWGQEQWFDRAHSVFLDWFVASGFVGLIAYLSLYVLFLMAIWKSNLTIAEKSVLTGLLAGYFIHNIFVFDNIASYVLFFSMLGFANSTRVGKEDHLFGTDHVSKDAVEYIVLPVVIVCFIVVVYSLQYRFVQANGRLITAMVSCNSQKPDATLFEKALSVNVYGANQEIREQLLSCSARVMSSQQVPGPTKQAFFVLASDEVEAQRVATPKDARIYVLGGSFFNSAGQYSQALSLLEKAHELSPNKQAIAFELASDYLNTGTQPDRVISLVKQAYESAPEYIQAKYAYATSLVALGKEAESKKIFGNEPAIFATTQMAQAYLMRKQYTQAIDIYKKLIEANPTDVNNLAQLAQIQYTAGRYSDAIATLRLIGKEKPELIPQIEVAVKQVEDQMKK